MESFTLVAVKKLITRVTALPLCPQKDSIRPSQHSTDAVALSIVVVIKVTTEKARDIVHVENASLPQESLP